MLYFYLINYIKLIKYLKNVYSSKCNRCFIFQTTLRIWDCLFYEGSKIIFRAGLMLVKHFKIELLACLDIATLAESFKLMTQDPYPLNCHVCIDVCIL